MQVKRRSLCFRGLVVYCICSIVVFGLTVRVWLSPPVQNADPYPGVVVWAWTESIDGWILYLARRGSCGWFTARCAWCLYNNIHSVVQELQLQSPPLHHRRDRSGQAGVWIVCSRKNSILFISQEPLQVISKEYLLDTIRGRAKERAMRRVRGWCR